MAQSPTRDRWEALFQASRDADLSLTKASDPNGFVLLLAARFEHDVRQGGFAQLLYNMRGSFLADMESMLLAAHASAAHDYYVRAIRICLDHKPEYQKFLSSDFSEPNRVKDALSVLSIEYLTTRPAFAVEAGHLLESDGS